MFISKGRFGIKLVPFGKIPADILDFLTDGLQKVFRKKVYWVKSQKIPIEAFNLNRTQYNAKSLLDYLASMKIYKEKTLGVINEDIYNPNSSFVFGSADPLKEVAIVSMWRFVQNMNFFDCDPDLFKSRLLKQAVHELGHTYGLRYCTNPECVMYNSQSIDEIDRKSEKFCSSCKEWL